MDDGAKDEGAEKKGEEQRQSFPAKPPTSAMAMVAARARGSIAGNQTMAGISTPEVSTQKLCDESRRHQRQR